MYDFNQGKWEIYSPLKIEKYTLSATLAMSPVVVHTACACVHRRVEEVVRFSGLPPRRQLTYQAKQTISREMEQEKMRRAEQLLLQRNPAVVTLFLFVCRA